MSRCAICGRKVYEGEYRDYEDPVRGKILFVCEDCDLPKESPPPVKRPEDKEEPEMHRPGRRPRGSGLA